MILSILEKYRPLFAPDGVEGGMAATPSGGAVPASGEAGSVQDGSMDTSEPFALSDDVMAGEDLDGFVEPGPPASGPQSPTGQPAAVPPSQQAQPPTPQPVAQQPAQQIQPQAPVGQPGTPAQPQSPQPMSPVQQLAQLMQNRDMFVGKLAESDRFKMTRADQEAMETNALDHIPKLLARTYFDAFTSGVSYVNQQVPQMIQSALQESKLDNDAENSFYAAWPGLDRGKHGADVLAYANAFRSMNPRASLEEAVKFVGAAVATKHGVQNANVRPTQGQPQPRGNGRRNPPFAPGMGSRAAPQAGQQVESNPFEGMGLTFD